MKSPTSRRKPLNVQVDYVTIALDVVNERLKSQGSELYQRECGVNLRELRLLRFIGNEPGMTLTRLIERAFLEKTLASKAVTALVQRGLVVRTVGPVDARQICLELTDAGVAMVMSAERIGKLGLDAFREALSDAEHATFRACLQKLARAGDEIVARAERGRKAARAAEAA
jgi:MarR family transcriptional regulator, temperature-dependent positive regulator of motility